MSIYKEEKSKVPQVNFKRQSRKRTAQEWEQRRYEIAKEAMCAMLSNPDIFKLAAKTAKDLRLDRRHTLGKWAVYYADELIHSLMMDGKDRVPQVNETEL